MKQDLKNALAKSGVFYRFDAVRRLPEIYRWIKGGCTELAPPPVKRAVIMSYMRRYGLTSFVETGTHAGDTLACIASDVSVACTSVELDDNLYSAARQRFQDWQNVSLLHGDSGVVVPQIVDELSQPTLFWLDGHYSGSGTAKGELDSPIGAELEAVISSTIDSHVILIDDARLFVGADGYPKLHDLLRDVEARTSYKAEVSADIIRLVPA